jgi:hypothetical protein
MEQQRKRGRPRKVVQDIAPQSPILVEENEMEDQNETTAAIASAETIAARVLRDYWDQDGERVPAGTVLDLTHLDLIRGMENGIFERVK